ncbi:MAG: hypothetical protein IK088_07645, partial [Lachnospiraceae bacterium]|nr:hypothetical protein [Lachnospiraceae bacterium]
YYFEKGQTLYLDLHGHTLHGTPRSRMFQASRENNVANDVTFVITDSVGGGEIDCHNESYTGAACGMFMYFQSTTGSLVLDGVTLKNISSTSVYGGAISTLNGSGASVTLHGTTVKDCKAANGGAFYISANSTLELNDSIVENAVSTGSGGGAVMLAGNGASCTMMDSVIRECTAGSQGGAFRIDGTASLFMYGDSKITNCASNGNAGSIFFTSGGTLELHGDSKIENGSAATNGGNISAGADAMTIRMFDRSAITGGQAGSSSATADNVFGGNIVLNNGVLVMNGDSRIENGTAVTASTTGGYGGNIRVLTGSVLLSDRAVISGGSASNYGGNIAVSNAGSIRLLGGTVKNGTAASKGGNVILNAGGSLAIDGASVYGGSASEGNDIYLNLGTTSVSIESGFIASITGSAAFTEARRGFINGGMFAVQPDPSYLASDVVLKTLDPSVTEDGVTYLYEAVYVEPVVLPADPDAVLVTKVQAAHGLIRTSSDPDGPGQYVLRFVSSVESLSYDSVGFEVTFEKPNGDTATLFSRTKTVTERIDSTILSSGGEKIVRSFGPKIISTESNYLVTAKWAVKPEDADMDFTVRAFGVRTGETVYGPRRVVSVSDVITAGRILLDVDSPLDPAKEYTVTYRNASGNIVTIPSDHVTVLPADENRTTIRLTDADRNLKSVTVFTVSDGSSSVEAVFRNLCTEYTGAGTEDTSWYDTDPSSDSFVIATSADLFGFRKLTANNGFAGKTFYMAGDITINTGEAKSFASEAPEYTWTPASQSVPFAGTFDGSMHKISGLYVNVSTAGAGFFSSTAAGSTVRNVWFLNGFIRNSQAKTGTVAGIARGTFDTIYSDLIQETSLYDCGGIGGLADQGTENLFRNCWFNGRINGTAEAGYYFGGIVGEVGESGTIAVTIRDCLVSGRINCIRRSTSSVVGGIVGNVYNAGASATLEDCLFTGAVNTVNTNSTATILAERRNGSVSLIDVYAVKSKYPAIGTFNSNGPLTGTVTIMEASAIRGSDARPALAGLNFNRTWMTEEGKTPILKSFKDYEETIMYPNLLNDTINHYSIVVPKSRSVLTDKILTYFQDRIADEYGAYLPVVTDETPEGECEIIVGNTTRDLSAAVRERDVFGYSVKSSGNRIALGYDDNDHLGVGFGKILELIGTDVKNVNESGTDPRVEKIEKAAGSDIRVMGNNIYNMNDHSFDSLGMPWEARAEILADVYRVYQPDFIGLTESTTTQLNEFLKYVGDIYAVVPMNDISGLSNNYTPLLYKKDLYEVEERFFHDFTGGRHLEWAMYHKIEDPSWKIIHMNLHYSPYDEEQPPQAEYVNGELKRVTALYPNVPIVVTGDYNSGASHSTFATMTEGLALASAAHLV